ncbi:molybdopterin-binding protein [Chamaesiphon sp.]|uniref:TOBE domain-containing protein n=1 Tax=Chamaesiphon sp. TaxID=2814140 RepID=UPI003592EF93
MPRKDQGWITFQLPEAERQLLESYCERMQRSKTDVLRQLVRGLDRELSDLSLQIATPQKSAPTRNLEIRAMRVSARNVFPAIVKQVRLGSINAEILLEIAPNVEAVSVITRSSAEALELTAGKPAYVTIKSSDVMVAVDD